MRDNSSHPGPFLVLCLALAAFPKVSAGKETQPIPDSTEILRVEELMAESWMAESGEYRPEILRDLAGTWKAFKRFDQALHLLGPVRASDQATGEDFFQTGYLLHRLGCREPALDAYGQALVMDPLHPEAHYNTALILKGIGDMDGAIHHFEEVLRMRPAYEPTYFDLAVLFLLSDRKTEAEFILGKYVEAGTDSLALQEALEMLRDLRDE